jgi:hypothetical protein
MVNLLLAVGLEQITSKYIYFKVHLSEQMLQRMRF